MFEKLTSPPEDALHAVATRYANDERPQKIDLGVGVYRDETGVSPVMSAVAAAEAARIDSQTSKSYLGLRGDDRFLEAMARLVFGDAATPERIASIQAVGGTGAVRLAVECVALANPHATVHIGLPTWPNHLGICEKLGLDVRTFEYFDKPKQIILFDNLRSAITDARSGDLLILHGPCHNPTGEDLSKGQFAEALELCRKSGVVPLIDAAYYGLGRGLEADLGIVRSCLESFPEAFAALSCSKTFSLYRERTGILFAAASSSKHADIVQAHLERIGRTCYSMSPAHGAAAVAGVLSDPLLTKSWREELEAMRARIVATRETLSNAGSDLPALSAVKRQIGIFSLLPINKQIVDGLARDYGIHMPQSGRINIAGLKRGDPDRFVSALRELTTQVADDLQ